MSNNADRIEDLRHEIEGVRSVLRQIPQGILSKPSSIEGYGTVGEHFRHIVNCIENLISHYPDKHIDFEKRQPDILLETQKDLIDSRLAEASKALAMFLGEDPDTSLTKTFCGAACRKVYTDKTTLGETINYVTFHINHHIPYIRLAVLHHGITTKSQAGIAGGTLRRNS